MSRRNASRCWPPTIADVNDYASINFDYTRGSDSYSAILLGQWSDYDEDGTCRNDDNGDGFTNASESINQAEIDFVGDSASTDGSGGNYNVFFNSDDLVLSRSIDLTHLYVLNNTAADSSQWFRECMSLSGASVDINFEFQSDDDGRNGINDSAQTPFNSAQHRSTPSDALRPHAESRHAWFTPPERG